MIIDRLAVMFHLMPSYFGTSCLKRLSQIVTTTNLLQQIEPKIMRYFSCDSGDSFRDPHQLRCLQIALRCFSRFRHVSRMTLLLVRVKGDRRRLQRVVNLSATDVFLMPVLCICSNVTRCPYCDHSASN